MYRFLECNYAVKCLVLTGKNTIQPIRKYTLPASLVQTTPAIIGMCRHGGGTVNMVGFNTGDWDEPTCDSRGWAEKLNSASIEPKHSPSNNG